MAQSRTAKKAGCTSAPDLPATGPKSPQRVASECLCTLCRSPKSSSRKEAHFESLKVRPETASAARPEMNSRSCLKPVAAAVEAAAAVAASAKASLLEKLAFPLLPEDFRVRFLITRVQHLLSLLNVRAAIASVILTSAAQVLRLIVSLHFKAMFCDTNRGFLTFIN